MAFNKRHFQDLKTILNGYKKDIDTIMVDALQEDKGLKNVYSEEYYKQFTANRIANAKTTMDEKRETARSRVNTILKNLHNDVSTWVDSDVDQNLLNRLQIIKTAGIKLSYSEIKLMAEQSKGQYLPLKILEDLAGRNGYLLQAPNAEHYLKEISDIERGCNTLINTYCGENAEGVKLLPHNIVNSIDYGQYAPWLCVNASYILKSGNDIDKAMEHWGDTITHVESKTSLTDAETDYIEGLYKNHKSDIANRTKELVKINPALKQQIALSEYAEFLPVEE